VEARAGAFDWNETGSRLSGVCVSRLPLLTKTLACVVGTITRGGCTPVLPEDVAGGGTGGAVGLTAGGACVSAGALTAAMLKFDEAGFSGKRGFVLACGGEPVSGGATGLWGMAPEGGRETLGIGLVTAVDQAGVPGGVGSRELDVFKGNVVAAEILGRAAGTILVDAGLSGRGGRLIRSVSRFGAFGSEPGEAESAIIISFYSYFGKSSMAKFAIVTYLWT